MRYTEIWNQVVRLQRECSCENDETLECESCAELNALYTGFARAKNTESMIYHLSQVMKDDKECYFSLTQIIKLIADNSTM